MLFAFIFQEVFATIEDKLSINARIIIDDWHGIQLQSVNTKMSLEI